MIPTRPHLKAQSPGVVYRFGFLMQQVLGFIGPASFLRRYVAADPDVQATWLDITFKEPGGWVERIPLLSEQRKGALRGLLQVRSGLGAPMIPLGAVGAGRVAARYDALLFSGAGLCRLTPDLVTRIPSVLFTDVTPLQLHAWRAHYGDVTGLFPGYSPAKHQAYVHMYTRLSRIVACSDWAKRSLMSDYHVPEEKIIVLPFSVDVTQWAPPVEDQRAAMLAAPGALPRILFVGGHFHRKGGDLLLDWFLRRGVGRCELHIVTRTPPAIPPHIPGVFLYDNLEANDPRLIQLYHTSHVFALPTRADCYSVASIEAMATGLPVVLTQVGGAGEIVTSGVDGYCIPPDDADALARSLDALLADPERTLAMGQAARATAVTRFDAGRYAERMLALMKEIAEERRPHA